MEVESGCRQGMTGDGQTYHVPIMLKEVLEQLKIRPDGCYVDGTLGGGGHSFEICRRLTRGGRLIGIDQDADAIAASTARLQPFADRVSLVRSNYAAFGEILDSMGIGQVDGILLDLGVSSHQLDEAERGFTYREDAPLDMRMDQRQEKTAAEVVNTYPERELFRVIRDYGEDRFAGNIARHIVSARQRQEIRTTGELAGIVKAAIPAKFRAGGHPAKQTFQAIRIEVNGELDVLAASLGGMIDRLKPGGRLCVITFHSLEDRIVKNCFREKENPCICPPGFPVCVCGRKPKGHVVGRKPTVPSAAEQEANSRSKSAKLRVFEALTV